MATFTQQSRDATARAARRGMPMSSWVGGSLAATQPQCCASRGGHSQSKGSGWGTIPACGSSLGNAQGHISRRQEGSEEPLRTPGSESGHCRAQRHPGCHACALPTAGECTPLPLSKLTGAPQPKPSQPAGAAPGKEENNSPTYR